MGIEAGRPIHLIGSIPFSSADEVFKEVAATLGPSLKRIPDGETGPRLNWIMTQAEPISRATNLEVGGERHMPGGLRNPKYKRQAGKRPEEVEFPPLGYASHAARSHEIFARLRQQQLIAHGVRFQVCLPTPLAVVNAFFIGSEIRPIWPVYERRLLDELDEIAAAIPHRDLAVQWDVCPELHTFMEVPQMQGDYPFEDLVQSIVRLCRRVPRDAELGLHFCYGDPGHKHVREPTDMSNMVRLYNRLSASLDRPIDWLHMPVPRDRDDPAYFAPLKDLALSPPSELYLGLIHLTDGMEGARRRLATARSFAPDFGVATECGFGRRPPETIRPLLELHKEVSQLDR